MKSGDNLEKTQILGAWPHASRRNAAVTTLRSCKTDRILAHAEFLNSPGFHNHIPSPIVGKIDT